MTRDWKVAIVTGGASGIGAALGEGLVRRSCFVLLADIDEEGVHRAAERISRIGPGRAVGKALDVRDAEAVMTAVHKTADGHGRLDLMFNNAGIAVAGYAHEFSLAHWQRAIDVDLYGVIHGVRAAYPLMLDQQYGHIVNTASLAGLGPAPGVLPYTTAKFGVVGLSLGLRAEAAASGVRVSVVVPGIVDTPILDKKHEQKTRGLPMTPSEERLDPIPFLLRMSGIRALYPPERVAEDVLRGVQANRAMIFAPAAARRPWRLWRFLPGPAEAITVRRFERERKYWDHSSAAVVDGA